MSRLPQVNLTDLFAMRTISFIIVKNSRPYRKIRGILKLRNANYAPIVSGLITQTQNVNLQIVGFVIKSIIHYCTLQIV